MDSEIESMSLPIFLRTMELYISGFSLLPVPGEGGTGRDGEKNKKPLRKCPKIFWQTLVAQIALCGGEKLILLKIDVIYQDCYIQSYIGKIAREFNQLHDHINAVIPGSGKFFLLIIISRKSVAVNSFSETLLQGFQF